MGWGGGRGAVVDRGHAAAAGALGAVAAFVAGGGFKFPAYWSAAEVKDQGEQPLSSLPVACLFAPPTSAAPTSLPLGQESYSCTRLLIGLSGLEGSMRGTSVLLQTDWFSQNSNWEELAGLVEADSAANPGRSVILMNPSGGLAGIGQLEEIVSRNQP